MERRVVRDKKWKKVIIGGTKEGNLVAWGDCWRSASLLVEVCRRKSAHAFSFAIAWEITLRRKVAHDGAWKIGCWIFFNGWVDLTPTSPMMG